MTDPAAAAPSAASPAAAPTPAAALTPAAPDQTPARPPHPVGSTPDPAAQFPRAAWRRATPADIACCAGLAAGAVAAYALAVLTPTLLRHHVVLLEALAGSIVAIITGGALARVGDAPLALVIAAPLCGIALYDVFLWWAGRRWGGRLAEMYARRRPRTRRAVVRAETLVRRHGLWALALAYYLPFPNALVYVACGASEMPLWIFVVGDILGTLLWEALLVSLGWAVGHDAVRIVTAVDHHATDVTLGLIAVIVVLRLGMRVRRRTVRAPS